MENKITWYVVYNQGEQYDYIVAVFVDRELATRFIETRSTYLTLAIVSTETLQKWLGFMENPA